MRRTINFLINLGEDIQEKKYSIGFLLDLSGSMCGEPLEQVKIAINNLLKPMLVGGGALDFADEVSMVTFHSQVQRLCPWIGENDFDFFREFLFGVSGIDTLIFRGSGATALYDGLGEMLNSTYAETKSKNEKVILIFSDGEENNSSKYSKEDIEELIRKHQFGCIKRELIEEINANDSSVLNSKILVEAPGKDYYLFEEGLDESKICSRIKSQANQSLLIETLLASRKPVRICSLYYRDGSVLEQGKAVLDNFARLTNGIVYIAPTLQSIPSVMKDLFFKLVFQEKSGIRNGLISRLNTHPIDGNSNWFRVFSINSHSDITPEAWVENQDMHSIFNTVGYNDACNSRHIALSQFAKDFINENLLSNTLISNFQSQNRSLNTVQSNPIVYITFRGNDLLGTSISENIYEVLQQIRKNPIDILGTIRTDYHVFLNVLIDHLEIYTEENNKNLSALLNEINTWDEDFNKIHGIFLISERNDHFQANPKGYKSVNNLDYEQLVIENLFNLNVHQNLVLDSYRKCFDGRNSDSDLYDRFLSIGSVTLHAGTDEYLKTLASSFCHDLMPNLYAEDFRTDHDLIKAEVEQFMAEMSFATLKQQILDQGSHPNLLSLIDCPGAIEGEFTPYREDITLKFLDSSSTPPSWSQRIIRYSSLLEYIRYLYFDVRNYVESCDSTSSFNQMVQEKILILLREKQSQLRNITDRMMFNGYLSSPLQAELWIERLNKTISEYLETGFDRDFENDVDLREYSRFEYKTSSGITISDSNPENPLGKLKDKLESFPLPIASRIKFYSFAFLLASGISSLTFIGLLPIINLIGLLVPALIIIWGEYRIIQSFRQLRELIKWYGKAHRFTARRQALEFLSAEIKEMLVNLKDKISNGPDSVSLNNIYSDNLNEQNYIDLFKHALTNSFTDYFKYETTTTQGSSRFNINLSDGFYNQNDVLISLLEYESLRKLTGTEDVTWNEFLNRLQNTRDALIRYPFPTVKVSFIPPGFAELLNTISQQGNINWPFKIVLTEIVKERLYYMTLLDELTNDEVKDLKDLYEHKVWHQQIDLLVNRFNERINLANINFFSLWRDVAFYQAWLNRIVETVSKDQDSSQRINTDYLFSLWKRMYQPRKEFRESLLKQSKSILSPYVQNNLTHWKVIKASPNGSKLTDHIKAFCFSPIYLTNPGNSYSPYQQLNYISEDRNSPANLKVEHSKSINQLLDDNRNYSFYVTDGGDYIMYSHFVVIPVTDNSFLQNLANIFDHTELLNNEHGIVEKHFLTDFISQNLRTKKQRNEFKFIFNK